MNMLASIHATNLARRDNLQLVIQSKFRKLRSSSKPVGDDFLFGGDLAEEVKEIDESS